MNKVIIWRNFIIVFNKQNNGGGGGHSNQMDCIIIIVLNHKFPYEMLILFFISHRRH